MKTMKKLQIAAAVAGLFAAATAAYAGSISQSGVTIAREVISFLLKLTPQVRLELTTLRLHFLLNFRLSVDYLINFQKKLSDARGNLIGLVSSIPSL